MNADNLGAVWPGSGELRREPDRDSRPTPRLLERAFALLALFDEQRPVVDDDRGRPRGRAAGADGPPDPGRAGARGLRRPRRGQALHARARGAAARTPRASRCSILERVASPLLDAAGCGHRRGGAADRARPGRRRRRLHAARRELAAADPERRRRAGCCRCTPGHRRRRCSRSCRTRRSTRSATVSCRPMCRATITRPDRLREHLREVRRRGWAISFEETDEGVWGIALPIVGEQRHGGRGVRPRRRPAIGSRPRMCAISSPALHEVAKTVAGPPRLQRPQAGSRCRSRAAPTRASPRPICGPGAAHAATPTRPSPVKLIDDARSGGGHRRVRPALRDGQLAGAARPEIV